MICFVDEYLDFFDYVTAYLKWNRRKSKRNEDHDFGILSWDKNKLNLGAMPASQKLYIIAHLNETTKKLANGANPFAQTSGEGLSANDAGNKLIALGLPKVEGIVLISCEGGAADQSRTDEWSFAQVLRDKLKVDAPITGYMGDVNVDMEGRVITYHTPAPTGETSEGSKEEANNEPDNGIDAWVGMSAPATPTELKNKILSLKDKPNWLAGYKEGLADIQGILQGTARKAKI